MKSTFKNNSDIEIAPYFNWLIDWLTALRHISTEKLLVPRNVTKLDMIKIRIWIQLCMKKCWLAGLMTHQYKKLPVTMKCGCSLTSCPGHPYFNCCEVMNHRQEWSSLLIIQSSTSPSCVQFGVFKNCHQNYGIMQS